MIFLAARQKKKTPKPKIKPVKKYLPWWKRIFPQKIPQTKSNQED